MQIRAIFLTAIGVLLTACADRNPPLVRHEIFLPDAVQGHAYYAEAELPAYVKLNGQWRIPYNSRFQLQQKEQGGKTLLLLSNDGKGYAHRYDGDSERLTLFGSSGGGRHYREHELTLFVRVRADTNSPELAYCTPQRPKPGALVYDCSKLCQVREQSVQDGSFCRKFPNECEAGAGQ